MPVDYSKSKIYKLTTPHDPELVYYGSTVNPLFKRKGTHKRKFKAGTLKCKSCILFELGEDDVIITLVENVNCNSKEELIQRERFFIENNNCVNKVIPGRTKKEWYEDNKEVIKEQRKEYREQNKEVIKEQKKEYYETNKDIIIQKVKEYQQTNKDIINQRRRERYQQLKLNQ
jgi:adenylate kinase family enzyme